MCCHICKKEITKNEVDNYFADENRKYCNYCYYQMVERKLNRVDFLIGLYYYCAKNYCGQWSREYSTMGRILNYFDYIQFKCRDLEYFFKDNIKDNYFMLQGYLLGFKIFHK